MDDAEWLIFKRRVKEIGERNGCALCASNYYFDPRGAHTYIEGHDRMSHQVRNSLAGERLSYTDVAHMTDVELRQLRNFGMRCIEIVRRFIPCQLPENEFPRS